MDLKARIGLLRIFADIDESYKQAQSDVEEAIWTLSVQKLSKEQFLAIRGLLLAYGSMNQRLLELACECMVFPEETKKK